MMVMYEARQNKEKVSRRIEGLGGVRQRKKIANNNLLKKSNSINKDVTQGFFNVSQTGINLNPSDANKIAQVRIYLAQMHQAVGQNEGDIEINIVNNGGVNPATTFIRAYYAGNPNRPIYRIELKLFYIRMSSVGEIAAMVLHELGVHDLADVQTGQYPRNLFQPLPGLNTPGRVDNAGAFNVLLGNNAYNLDPATAGQADHVNAVDFSANITARANNYLRTYLELGDAIPMIGSQTHRDLTKTFLFDIARILVTNDGGTIAIGTHPAAIADAMWNVYQNVLLPEAFNHPWINGTYAQQTGFEVFSYLLKTLTSGIGAKMSARMFP